MKSPSGLKIIPSADENRGEEAVLPPPDASCRYCLTQLFAGILLQTQRIIAGNIRIIAGNV
jgi:hypothetical protein